MVDIYKCEVIIKYIRTVEFYFHSEKPNGIHDPIVYHRNIRDLEGNLMEKVPYFPIMSLHAHSSGYDITFESKVGELLPFCPNPFIRGENQRLQR